MLLATILLQPAATFAAPHDWAEGRDDADDGATRDYYNRGALLPWRNENGDWVDRDGTAQGDAAWASTPVDDTDEARYVEWDVTALVQRWVDGSLPNLGFFLRTDTGSIRFASRESASDHPPELVVDGTTLSAVADTHLTPSTYQSLGESETLSVGSGNNALLRFDVSGTSGPIGSATLRLYTTHQYGSADVGVFLAAPGRQGPPRAYETGLAAGFDRDEGIAEHPDVVFAADFEADDWMDGWTSHGGDFDVVDGSGDFGFEPLRGRSLRAVLLEGELTALNTRYDFMDELGEEPDEIYLRYYLRLGSDWNQSVEGGKLPGISGTYGVAGWGGRRSDGTNGWSARGLFRQTVPAGENPLAGHTPIGSYVYHADQETTYGDNFIWVDGWGEEGFGGLLRTERWYALEYHVRLNTPGERDGVIRAWVDGRLSFEATEMRFRTVDTLAIEAIWMNIYHGGTTPSPYDQHAFIDQVVVARSYIGPMTGGPTPPGADGGTPSADGGTPSADGGPVLADGGPALADGSPAPADAGPSAGGDAGCGCRVGGVPNQAPSPLLLALALLVATRARRRRIERTRDHDADADRTGT